MRKAAPRRRTQEQKVTIVHLKRQVETLLVCVKEHDSKIQRVSDQVETNKGSLQVVSSEQ